MNKFYENNFKYKEVYEMFDSIIVELKNKKVDFYFEKIMELQTPTFHSEIIPTLKKIYPNDINLEDAISKIINIKNFNNHTVKDIENSIFNENYVILDNIIFFVNPLSVEALSIKEIFKEYGNNELLFNDFGLIFEYQIKDLLNKKNLILQNKKFDVNDLSMDKIFQDLIKTSIEKKATKLKIFEEDNNIKVHFFIDGQYIKNKELSIFSINNYEKFRCMIDLKFKDKSFLRWKHHISYYNILLSNNNKDEIYLEIYDLRKDIPNFNQLSLNEKDKLELKRVLESPSGLLVISGNDDSGKRTTMYSILKYISELKNGVNIVSFENEIKNDLDFLTQIKSSDLLLNETKSFSVVAIDNNISNENINKCLELSAKGKFVIAVLESSSISNTLSIINEQIENKNQIIENLIAFIHVGLFNKLCDGCSSEINFNKSNKFHNFIALENAPALNDVIKEENDSGCSYCNYGYSGRIQLCEIVENDNILKDLFLDGFNMTKFKIEKRSKYWNSIFENSMAPLKEGVISLNSIIKSIGYYKK